MIEKWWKTRLIFFLLCSIRPLSLNVYAIFEFDCFLILIKGTLLYIWLTCYSFGPFLFSCLSRLICWQMRSRVYQLPGGHASWNPHWSRIGWRPRSTSVAVWRLQSRCRVGQQDGEQRPTRVSLSACLKKLCFVVYNSPSLTSSISILRIHPSVTKKKEKIWKI